MKNPGKYGILLLCAGLAAGCGDDDSSNAGEEAADAAEEDGEAMGEALGQQAELEIRNDPPTMIVGQIGDILLTIDGGELLQAEAELELGAYQPARAYAELMRTEHSRHLDDTEVLLEERQISPVDNPISEMLQREAQAGADELRASPPNGVDFAYMQLQVRMHAAGYVLVGQLIELAPDDQRLRDFLDETRAAIERHRDEAAALLREM